MREVIVALCEEFERDYERHLAVTARSAPDHRPCETGARAKVAERLRAILALFDVTQRDDDAVRVPRSALSKLHAVWFNGDRHDRDEAVRALLAGVDVANDGRDES